MNATTRTIVTAIGNGEVDEYLTAIADACKARRTYLANLRAMSLKPGDTVQFSDVIRPRYVESKTATVVRVNAATITDSCPDDATYSKFSGSRCEVPEEPDCRSGLRQRSTARGRHPRARPRSTRRHAHQRALRV